MILDTIVESRVKRLEESMSRISYDEIKKRASVLPKSKGFPFEEALKKSGIHVIMEVKKASPSKGILANEFDYKQIAKEYEDAGAAAISVLTEPDYFLGKNSYLTEIASVVDLPLLRKDFIIHDYMIYEAKVLQASAILLICGILTKNQLRDYLAIAEKLQLSAVVEVHDEKEVKVAIDAGARIIGVNNRDLKTFQVDVTTSLRLRKQIPEDILFISESGIHSNQQVEQLREIGTNGILVGEHFMKCENKKEALQQLLGENYEG